MDIKLISIISLLILIYILETIFPHYPGRKGRARHAFPHITTAVLNGLLTRFALAGITMSVIAWAQERSLGIFRLPDAWGLVAPVTAFILFDIWMYYWHMANHRLPFLWRFHRAHHSDIAMDTTTALRFHPGELVLSTFIRLPILVLLGMKFEEVLLFEVMLNSSALFHHSNLAVPEAWDRVLRLFITTPNMHRVHHSVVLSETDSNYTSILSVWDRLAQTYRIRSDTRAINLGLPQYREDEYQRLWGFLKTPFIRTD